MHNSFTSFTLAETYALLDDVRANYSNMMAKHGISVTAKMNHKIWNDITKSVNATGSGQLRTLDQVEQRWKNVKQKATKYHSESQNPKTGNKPFKRGSHSRHHWWKKILQAVYGSQSVSQGGESGLCGNETETLDSETNESNVVILTPVEAEPEDPLVIDKHQQEDPHSSGVEPPHKRRCLEKDLKSQNLDLVKKETERAEKQISLADEQIKLTLLQQRERKLRICLLEERLKDAGIALSEEEM